LASPPDVSLERREVWVRDGGGDECQVAERSMFPLSQENAREFLYGRK
jgi:hypothetical protein